MSQFYTASSNGGGDAITSIETENATPQFVTVEGVSTIDFGLTNLVLGSDLPNIDGGLQNVGLGDGVLDSLTSGTGNVAIGFIAGMDLTEGQGNVVIGEASGQSLTTGNSNTFVGDSSGDRLITGSGNTGIGREALGQLLTGSNNIVVSNGAFSGQNITGATSSTIIIGNSGELADSNTIRIGTQGNGDAQQNRAFIAGITGVTVSGSEPVGVDTNGQLSGLGFGTAGQVLTSNGAGASPTYQTPTAGTVTSVSGTADRITSTGGATPVIDIASTYVGQTSLTTLGTVTTGTWEATDIGVAHGGTGVSTITGLVSGNGTANMVGRTITGTANEIDVANGDGSTANPTLSLPSTIHVDGISFDAGTNTLSEYEEGTWTPALTGSGGAPTITYTSQVGSYTRIGNTVVLRGVIVINTISGGSGSAQVTGLPFTVINSSAPNIGSVQLNGVNFESTAAYVTSRADQNTTNVRFYETIVNAVGQTVSITDFAAGDSVSITVEYRV